MKDLGEARRILVMEIERDKVKERVKDHGGSSHKNTAT